VLLLPRAVRILLAAQPVDMRNSIDGLAAIIRTEWKEDLYAGDLFVFVSRRGDRTKVLTWDNGGFVLFYKRLEQGRFRLPAFREGTLGARLQSSQLAMLLDGIDLSRVRRPRQGVPSRTQFPTRGRCDLVRVGSEEHDCASRAEAERLVAEFAQVPKRQQQLEGQLAAPPHHVFGQRSERRRRSPSSSGRRSRSTRRDAGHSARTPRSEGGGP